MERPLGDSLLALSSDATSSGAQSLITLAVLGPTPPALIDLWQLPPSNTSHNALPPACASYTTGGNCSVYG